MKGNGGDGRVNSCPETGKHVKVWFIPRGNHGTSLPVKYKQSVGVVIGRGDAEGELSIEFDSEGEEEKIWSVPLREIEFIKSGDSNRARRKMKKPVCEQPMPGPALGEGDDDASPRAQEAALLACVSRIGWNAKIKRRGIIEVNRADNDECGSYGKRPAYQNGKPLEPEGEDEKWRRRNKPRIGGECSGDTRYNGEFCEVCGEGAAPGGNEELILCEGHTVNVEKCIDGEIRGYHLDCLDRPLEQVPEGRWMCGLCRRIAGGAPPTAPTVPDRATKFVRDVFGIAGAEDVPPLRRDYSSLLSKVPTDFRIGLICGASGSGKSTLLGSLTREPPGAATLRAVPAVGLRAHLTRNRTPQLSSGGLTRRWSHTSPTSRGSTAQRTRCAG